MSKTRPSQFRAGAAKIDISPVTGIQVGGDIGRYRPCAGVQDPIYARALALEQDGKRFCVLSLDLLAIDNPWSDELRRRAKKAYGLPAEAVMVHCTQNHAAPSIGNHFCRDSCKLMPDDLPWLRGGDPRYNEPALKGILAAMGKALDRLTPVKVAAGRAIDGRIGFNRRFMMRDHTAMCQPPQCSPDILHVEGPADPEVGVVTFTAANGRVVSALLHHTAHPCNGFWGNEIFPDWPGAWCQEMESHFGAGCTPLVINGCCGNVITWNYTDPDQLCKVDWRKLGRWLADSTKLALNGLTPIEPTAFAWASRNLPVPDRKIARDLLVKAKKLLKDHPEPVWTEDNRVSREWVYSVGLIDMAEEQAVRTKQPYEIQAMRLGDFALVALMGEPFAETQLGIKKGSPFAFTQVAHLCNGYACYIPTRQALAGGGYETLIGFWSRFAPGAAEMIERAAVELLGKLAGKKG